MKTIGLTGGIGAGKSTVSRYLEKKGYEIIDADLVAREVVLPGSTVLERLEESFGKEILNQDETLNRKLLGSFVFADLEKKKLLDEIIQGAILGSIENQWADFVKKNAIHSEAKLFLDAALLFESGLAEKVDEIWVVTAPDSLRLERVMRRDGLTELEVLKRMENQMPEKEKKERADFILINSGSEEDLERQIDGLLEK